jgi:hypothetical protein
VDLRRGWALARVVAACIGLSLGFGTRAAPLFAQEHMGPDLRGHHPARGAPDPYDKAADMSGNPCCHAKDCTRFYGDPVRHTNAKGERGWFFGKFFVRDDQLIEPLTLPRNERGFHQICVAEHEGGKYQFVRCGFVAMGT